MTVNKLKQSVLSNANCEPKLLQELDSMSVLALVYFCWTKRTDAQEIMFFFSSLYLMPALEGTC